jgi:hypothetical protein
MTSQKTIIPISRLKLTLLTVGALGFIVAGFYILKGALVSFHLFSILVIIIGVASILFFGACFLFGVFRLLSNKPGLILTADGFEDYSSFIGGQFIKWQEVEGIDSLQVQKQNFIRVFLKDPNNIIAKAKGLRKFAMKMNYKFYGSPIHISANSLTYKFSKLQEEFYGTWHSSKK